MDKKKRKALLAASKAKREALGIKPKSKYGNIKVERILNGEPVTFDSIKEALRYDTLYLMARQGLITELTLQPKYELQSGYVHEDKTVKPINYIADFRYVHKGFVVVEDVKGMLTDIYRLKKKLFLYKYGTQLIFKET